MMTLDEFIKSNNVTCTTRLIDEELLKEAEQIIGVDFGAELKKYILDYGYLCYKHIELYGINTNQKMKSDLITQSIYLHKYFPVTSNLIAIENQGEGDYYLVDNSDNVYEYDSELDELTDCGMKLYAYVLSRFSSIA